MITFDLSHYNEYRGHAFHIDAMTIIIFIKMLYKLMIYYYVNRTRSPSCVFTIDPTNNFANIISYYLIIYTVTIKYTV